MRPLPFCASLVCQNVGMFKRASVNFNVAKWKKYWPILFVAGDSLCIFLTESSENIETFKHVKNVGQHVFCKFDPNLMRKDP